MLDVRFLIFFSIVLLILFGSHLWIAWRFSSAFQLSMKPLFLGVATASVIGIPAGIVLSRTLSGPLQQPIGVLAYSALGLFSLVFAFTLLADAIHLLSILANKLGSPPLNPQRRQVLMLGVLALSGGLGFLSFRRRRRVTVVSVDVPIANLPESLDGFVIAQLSDIHIGPTLQAEFLQDVVSQTNALGADLIAVTGDLVDGSVAKLRDHVAPLSELTARHGAFFVTGNHEYYSGAEAWCEEVSRLGLTVLNNAHTLIEHDGGALVVAGVTDLKAGSILPEHATDPKGAVADAPQSDVRILLAHQPQTVFAAADLNIDLQLSGHTHGGQYFPGTVLIRLAQPFYKGLEKFKSTWIYVNCGTGYWGPPFRLGAPAEISRLVLRRAA